jgi:hypothetical protein
MGSSKIGHGRGERIPDSAIAANRFDLVVCISGSSGLAGAEPSRLFANAEIRII